MAEGETLITNCLDADDTRYALEALRTIGFDVSGSLREGVRIGERKSMSANEVPIFVGNAGTAMRFLTGWLAFTPGRPRHSLRGIPFTSVPACGALQIPATGRRIRP